MTEVKVFFDKIDEFINTSLNTSAALRPRHVALFGLLLFYLPLLGFLPDQPRPNRFSFQQHSRPLRVTPFVF
jgi:hypothetical protein